MGFMTIPLNRLAASQALHKNDSSAHGGSAAPLPWAVNQWRGNIQPRSDFQYLHLADIWTNQMDKYQ